MGWDGQRVYLREGVGVGVGVGGGWIRCLLHG
jgi:hypothetical protein